MCAPLFNCFLSVYIHIHLYIWINRQNTNSVWQNYILCTEYNSVTQNTNSVWQNCILCDRITFCRQNVILSTECNSVTPNSYSVGQNYILCTECNSVTQNTNSVWQNYILYTEIVMLQTAPHTWMLYLWRGYGSNESHWYATLLNAVWTDFKMKTRMHLTLPMLRLLSSNAQVCKPCHVGIHWIALTEYFHMSTHVHVPGFQSFWGFFASFRIGKISHQQ